MAHGVEVMPPKRVYESERPPSFHSLQQNSWHFALDTRYFLIQRLPETSEV